MHFPLISDEISPKLVRRVLPTHDYLYTHACKDVKSRQRTHLIDFSKPPRQVKLIGSAHRHLNSVNNKKRRMFVASIFMCKHKLAHIHARNNGVHKQRDIKKILLQNVCMRHARSTTTRRNYKKKHKILRKIPKRGNTGSKM